jgi:hypothetical protein
MTWYLQAARTDAGSITRAGRASRRDVAQRIGPFIAELGRIGSAADADRIHNQQDGPGH